jgi:hypothetical protein
MQTGGTLKEELKFGKLLSPVSRTDNITAQYNFVAAATGTYIDTMGWDELIISITQGVATGSGAIAATVVGCATDDYASATLCTGATFTTLTSATNNTIQRGHLICKSLPRYIWVKTIQSDSTGVIVGADYILGKGRILPETNTSFTFSNSGFTA